MIKFGTSGWRAIMADEFTFDNLRRVTDAIAGVILESRGSEGATANGSEPRMFVGYDTRFLSEQFADAAASVLAGRGIRCVVSETPIPTPAVAHTVREFGFDGAVNITASHNPAEYNGLKFSTAQGAPAPLDVTKTIEEKVAAGAPAGSKKDAGDLISRADHREAYFAQLARHVKFDAIKKAGVKIALDLRWGAARGWYDAVLDKKAILHTTIHDTRDVTYGGEGPDVSERTLAELARTVTAGGFTLGLACDGDADRFGVVDADGTWISPNLLLALLADYLADTRGFRQGLGRTYATTGLIDAVAKHYDILVHQTPVGFKYLGELILDDKAFLAGEESAGMSIAGHVPEKDGLLAGLLAAEMVATKGKSIGQLKDDLFAKVGPLYSGRSDFTVTDPQKEALKASMKAPPTTLGPRRVASHTVWDGLRLDFDDGAWILMRPSGTEPVVRCYVEAPTEAAVEELMATGKSELIGEVG